MKNPDNNGSTTSPSDAGSGSGVGAKRGFDDAGSSSSNPFDCVDSPEWDSKTMQRMILKMIREHLSRCEEFTMSTG